MACEREISEELGLTLTNLKLLHIDNFDPEWEVHIFHANIVGEPSIQEPDKCTDLKWVPKNELRNVNLTDYSRYDFKTIGWL